MEHITVLMSAYNGEKYIEEQIESLLVQENSLNTQFGNNIKRVINGL